MIKKLLIIILFVGMFSGNAFADDDWSFNIFSDTEKDKLDVIEPASGNEGDVLMQEDGVFVPKSVGAASVTNANVEDAITDGDTVTTASDDSFLGVITAGDLNKISLTNFWVLVDTALGLGTMAVEDDAPSDGTGYVRKDAGWVAEGAAGEENVQADWNEADTEDDAYIVNKPTLFDGAYSSLTGLPSLVTTWLGLSDTPSSYSGQAGKYTKVNAGEDALEFGVPEGAGNVQAPDGNVVDGNLVAFDGASGELLKDSLSKPADFEPADATILKDADIGVSVQAYSADMDTDSTDDFDGAYSSLSGRPAIPTASSLSVDDLISLSGVVEGSTNLGEFSGSTIIDNQTNKQAIQALETAIESLPGGHDAVDLDASATTGGMSLDGQTISLRPATNAQTGYATAAQIAAIEANTSKDTNVSTALSTGTRSATTYGIDSDGESDDLVILGATTDYAGLLTAALFDEIDANTAKTTFPGWADADALDSDGALSVTPLYSSDFGSITITLGDEESPTDLGVIGYDGSNIEVGNGTGTDIFIPEGEDTSYATALGDDDNYVTDVEKTVIGNTSGTNSGDNAVNSTYDTDSDGSFEDETWFPGESSGGLDVEIVTENFNIASNTLYIIKPSSNITGTVTTSTAEDFFDFTIPYSYGTYTVTIDFNSEVFNFGTDDQLVIDKEGAYGTAYYTDSTVGWRLKNIGYNDVDIEAVGDTTAPSFVSATLGTDGETLTIEFDENVNIGTGGSAGWTLEWTDAGSDTLTYDSGDGTDTLVYIFGTVVNSDDTVADGLDYTQPTDGLEDDGGIDLISFTSKSVTNNSEEGGATYLVNQNFEGTGYDNSESWTESIGTSGTADEDSTTNPGRGSQSLLLTSGTDEDTTAYTTFTDQTEVWVHTLFKISDATPGSSLTFLEIQQSAQTRVRLQLQASGTITLYNGTTTAAGSTVLSDDTWYHLWIRYVQGTGSDGVAEFYISATTTRGSAESSISTGTSMSIVNRILLHGNRNYDGTQYTNTWDHVLVDDAEIGDI